MWSISSEDVQRAKERAQLRRSAIEARHAEELKALDAEIEVIATLERAAAEFASKKAQGQEDVSPDLGNLESSVEMGPGNGEGKAGSRWRLHLGNRPADAEGGPSPPASR
jgi:hypothetical protein